MLTHLCSRFPGTMVQPVVQQQTKVFIRHDKPWPHTQEKAPPLEAPTSLWRNTGSTAVWLATVMVHRLWLYYCRKTEVCKKKKRVWVNEKGNCASISLILLLKCCANQAELKTFFFSNNGIDVQKQRSCYWRVPLHPNSHYSYYSFLYHKVSFQNTHMHTHKASTIIKAMIINIVTSLIQIEL